MAVPSNPTAALAAQVESIEKQLEKLQAKVHTAEGKLNAAQDEIEKKVRTLVHMGGW